MEITQEIIQRYHQGHCNEIERQAVENWLQQEKATLSFPEGIDMDALQEEAWETFQEKRGPSPFFTKKLGYRTKIYAGIAASVVLLLGITYFLWPAVSPQEVYKTIQVPVGKKMTLTLSDGTRVHLNSGSTFQYPARFGNQSRQVRLEGEAYFDIAQDTKRPFLAETPRSLTKVLGTRFNLRDFVNEETSSIVVEQGKVQYRGKEGTDSVILLAGDQGTWNTAYLEKSEVNSLTYTDWKDQVLRFNDIPLADAVPMIERWYGIHIELRDESLAQLHIKVSFRNAPLRKVLNDLTYLMNLHYKINENQVLLYRQNL